MKIRSLATIASLCAILSASVYADLTGTFKTIILDGSLDDWSNPADVIYDDVEIFDGVPTNSSYQNVYLANDAVNLYVGLEMKESGGADITNAWTHTIYIDEDKSPATGFNGGWMANGYDRMIQYGAGGAIASVYEFTGPGQSDWGWAWLGLINYGSSNNVAEIAIPLSALGLSTDSFLIELSVTGGGILPENETWAYGPEEFAEAYTVAAFTGGYPEIVIDGSLEEWENPGHVFYNDAEIVDGAPANSSYENVYVVNNASELFIGLDMKGAGGAAITNTWTHNIYLDTDMDGATGFDAGWMVNGYDHLIQYGISGGAYSVYSFAGTNQAHFAWNLVGEFTYAYSNDVVEMSVPLYMLNLATNTMVMELSVTGSNVVTETWAYQWETGAKTYTLLDNGEIPPLIPVGDISIAPLGSGDITLSWFAVPGQSYEVEYKTNLVGMLTWLNYTTFVADVVGDMSITSSVDQAESYYQVITY